MTVLSVNLNKVALVRNSRGGSSPSVVKAARTVLAAGAAGITVHPRPDQRHVRPHDMSDLAELLADYPGVEFNIEGNPFAGPRDNGYPGFDALIDSAHPHQATLVPDSDSQLTSDHGWDLSGDTGRLRETIGRYQAAGARVSLFMDPLAEQIDRARECGADRIELYTGPFDLYKDPDRAGHLKVRSKLMNLLAEYIGRKGFNQTEAAEHFGVSQGRISELLNGRISKFTIDYLINMCSCAGIEVDVTFADTHAGSDT